MLVGDFLVRTLGQVAVVLEGRSIPCQTVLLRRRRVIGLPCLRHRRVTPRQ